MRPLGSKLKNKFNLNFLFGPFLVELSAIFQLSFPWEAYGDLCHRLHSRYTHTHSHDSSHKSVREGACESVLESAPKSVYEGACEGAHESVVRVGARVCVLGCERGYK